MIVYQRMPKDIYPDLNAPLVNIITENPGMASEDVERLISFPLESLLAGAPGVTRVRSESTTGDSVVTVEFDWGTDIYLARQIVSSKLELIAGRLPLGTSEPILGPVSSRMGEVFEFAVVGRGRRPDGAALGRRLDDPLPAAGRARACRSSSTWAASSSSSRCCLNPEMLAALRHHHRATCRQAIENSNRNFSGGILTKGAQEMLIKGVGPHRDARAHPGHGDHLAEQRARPRRATWPRSGWARSSAARRRATTATRPCTSPSRSSTAATR